MISIIYYVQILLILFLFLIAINKFYKNAPIKIKIFFILCMIGILIRNLSILFMSIVKDSSLAYNLKGIVYLDYLIVPLVIICIYYVYFRIDNFSFNKIYLLSLICICLYVIFIKFSQGKIILNNMFGYIIKLNNKR